ncbi:hypothetical protein ACSQ67_001325 [Phaseolus vulgaris]
MGGLHVLYVDECMMVRERQSDVTSVIEWGCGRNSFGGVLGVLQIISRTCVMLGVMRSRVLGPHKRLSWRFELWSKRRRLEVCAKVKA